MLIDIAKKSFPRKARIEPMILRVVSETLLTGVQDPRLKGVIVTKTELSHDLSHAKVFIELSDQTQLSGVVSLLNKSHVQGFFRHQLSQQLPLKRVPKLYFLSDKFHTKTQSLLTLIDDAMAQIEPDE